MSGSDDQPGASSPGRQFYVPAPGGTPDPPQGPPPRWRPGPDEPDRSRPTPPRPPAPPVGAPPAQPSNPPGEGPLDPKARDTTASTEPPASTPGAPSPRPPDAQPAGPRPPRGRGPGPDPAGRRRIRAPRPKWRWLYLYLPLLIVALLIGGVAWAFTSYRGIERIDLQGALDPVTGNFTNYLLVGSDSRENLDPDVADGGESTVTGKRSDTIILLHVGPDGSSMMSIPRDLWVTNAETGKPGRINGSYNSGPANLVLTVKQNLEVPVHHYMEVGFDSFAGVVDAVGGIEVEVAHPAFDEHSGLLIETPGKVTLDGDQALAYVRSRHYTEVIDGRNVEDPTADIGRQHRQQVFLQTALAEVGSTRNPVTLLRSASAMSKGLTIDDQTGFVDLVGLARDMSAQSPKSVVLPTKPARKGGAAVLVLDQPEADEVLATFAS